MPVRFDGERIRVEYVTREPEGERSIDALDLRAMRTRLAYLETWGAAAAEILAQYGLMEDSPVSHDAMYRRITPSDAPAAPRWTTAVTGDAPAPQRTVPLTEEQREKALG